MRPAKKECNFFSFFELVDIHRKFPCISAGASLLSFGLFLKSVLKFHGVGTALMRTFWLVFDSAMDLFSDVYLTQGSSRESYSSNWSQNFRALPRNRYRYWRLSVLWYATQLSYTFHSGCRTFVTTLSTAFYLVIPQPSSAEMSTLHRIYIPFQKTKLTFERIPIVTKGNLVQVPSKKFLHGCRLDFPDWLSASEAPFSRRTSTSLCWWLRGWSSRTQPKFGTGRCVGKKIKLRRPWRYHKKKTISVTVDLWPRKELMSITV